MKYGTLVGWGIVIYAVMALAWSGIVIYGFAGTFLARLFELLVLTFVATIAGRALRHHSWKDILPYSLAWALMMAVFDALFSVPFAGWAIYADWNLWLGYALVALVPLIAPKTRIHPEVPRIS